MTEAQATENRQQRLAELRAKEGLEIQAVRDDSRARTLANRITQRRANEAMMEIRRNGGCTASTVRCPEARIMLLDTPECCKAHIRQIMGDVAAMLDGAGIRWWIDYGTLLGYAWGEFIKNFPQLPAAQKLKAATGMDEPGLIPWDKDCDLGVLADDRAKLKKLQADFLAMRYHATFSPVRPTQRFRSGDRMKVRLSNRNHTNVDIFVWYRRPGKILDRKNYIGADLYKGREFPLDLALPLKRGQWDGIDVSVPAKPEQLAEHRYGASWREPSRQKHPTEVRK